jgi:hypothetical protein
MVDLTQVKYKSTLCISQAKTKESNQGGVTKNDIDLTALCITGGVMQVDSRDYEIGRIHLA